jgi:hypothetical protein
LSYFPKILFPRIPVYRRVNFSKFRVQQSHSIYPRISMSLHKSPIVSLPDCSNWQINHARRSRKRFRMNTREYPGLRARPAYSTSRGSRPLVRWHEWPGPGVTRHRCRRCHQHFLLQFCWPVDVPIRNVALNDL